MRISLPFLCLLTVAACGGSSNPTSPPGDAPVATVTVTPPATTLAIGETIQLTAELRGADGKVLTGRTITWKSSNPAVASVSSTGLVTAMASGGPVTITATSEGKSGSAQVSATAPVATVSVSPPATSLATGGTVQLTAELRGASGNVLTGRTITWTSSDHAIATVSGTGLVTGVAAGGPVTITATSEGKSGSAEVTVTASVATVTVSPPAITLATGETVQLSAELRSADDQVLTGRTITWMSSDPSIATVSGTGLVTAVTSGGPVTITATSDGRSGTAQVTVTAPITFVSLATGYQHTCALTAEGAAWCWGRNDDCQLGSGNCQGDILSPVAVTTDLRFSQITTGGYYTCGLTMAGEVGS